MRIFFLGCLIGCLFVNFSQAQMVDEKQIPPLTEQAVNPQLVQFLVQGNNRFAFECYKSIKNRKGNLCFSPFSISRGLAMIAMGAGGETANEIQKALTYTLRLIPLFAALDKVLLTGDPYTKNASKLFLANAIWLNQKVQLLPSFKSAYQRTFNATVQYLDFSREPFVAAQKINQWIGQETNGKIGQIVKTQDFPPQTEFVLTTAMYMKGQWEAQFDQRQTKRLSFRVDSRRTITAEMMRTTLRALLWKGEKWDIVLLPFVPGKQEAKLAMLFLIPKTLEEMNEMESQLTRDNWHSWMGQLRLQGVTLLIPRFRIEDRFEINRDFISLGISSIFKLGADFSAMTGEKGIFLNAAMHKTVVKIDEKGSDAGVVGVDLGSHELEEGEIPYELTADHPFVFVIMDQTTQSILWMGRVVQP